MKSLNNDYNIIFKRQESMLWYTDESLKYLCKIIFKNNLDIEVFNIITSEIDMFILIDNIFQFLDSNLNNTIVPIVSNKLINFNIVLKRNLDKIYFIIEERNNQINLIFERIKIEFNEDTLLEFANKIYFTFLIDIDNRVDSYYDFYS